MQILVSITSLFISAQRHVLCVFIKFWPVKYFIESKIDLCILFGVVFFLVSA